ncbi:MAG: DUF5652 family protein [Methanomassiliicoccales archaeon]
MKFKHHRHPIIMLLIIYNLIVKFRSLWLSARNNHRGWFLLLAITNTFGFLNRLYAKRI